MARSIIGQGKPVFCAGLSSAHVFCTSSGCLQLMACHQTVELMVPWIGEVTSFIQRKDAGVAWPSHEHFFHRLTKCLALQLSLDEFLGVGLKIGLPNTCAIGSWNGRQRSLSGERTERNLFPAWSLMNLAFLSSSVRWSKAFSHH